jgi:ribosome biogenesis GTPase A
MSLQWYPGHMTKARRELAALMPSQDVVIEVLDARLPEASANPVVTELRQDKPCIKVLTKSDLADPAVTTVWLEYLAAQPNTSAFASTTRSPQTAQADRSCARGWRRIAADSACADRRVPNVGKSTLINIPNCTAAVG